MLCAARTAWHWLLVYSCLFAACSAPRDGGQATIASAAEPPTNPARGIPWPQSVSDLPPDPALQFARLPNGLRYVWKDYPHPPGRCSLRLVVHVGSLDEQDDERGMAHFVEHMAFNGTKRFPGNQLDEWFRQRGMRAFRDTTAFTSFVDTTYCIDLPTSDAAALQESLEVLCDFATGMLFDPAEVEAEKGVIDAEERERSSARGRSYQECFQRLAAGTRSAARMPIGVAAQRAGFTAAALRRFHARWYRPDNMTLVLIGDLRTADVPAQVAAAFGGLPAPSVALPARFDRGTPTFRDVRFTIEDADRRDAEFLVLCPRPIAARVDTQASLRQAGVLRLAAELAIWHLNLPTVADSPVTGVRIARSSLFGLDTEIDAIVLQFQCLPARAAEAVTLLGRELTGIRARGFTPQLFERARNGALKHVAAERDSSRSADGADVANRVAGLLGEGRVPTSIHWVCDEEERILMGLDAEACSSAFRAAWECAEPAIVAIAPQPLGFDPAVAWAAAAPASVAPQPAPADGPRQIPDWPYAVSAVGPTPQPAARSHHEQLDLEDVRFANGVRLLVKRTEFAAKEILVSVSLGGGHAALPDALLPAAVAFAGTRSGAGLGKLSATELRAVCETRQASVTQETLSRSYELRGRTNAEGLAFQLEWLMAECTDPALDEEALALALKKSVPIAEQNLRSSSGALRAFFGRVIGRQMETLPGQLAEVQLLDLRRFFDAAWRKAPLTITVVGDLEVEATIAQVARTFGALAPRKAREDAGALQYSTPGPGLHEELDIEAAEDASTVALLVPFSGEEMTTDFATVCLVCRTLAERLRARIREQLGETYSPALSIVDGTTRKAWPALLLRIRTAFGKERVVLENVEREMERLRTTALTDKELDGMRAGTLRAWAEEDATNAGWHINVSRVHRDPDALDWLANRNQALLRVTPADLKRVAARCLDPASLSTVILRAKERVRR